MFCESHGRSNPLPVSVKPAASLTQYHLLPAGTGQGLLPRHFQKAVQVLETHGGDPVHIDFGICKECFEFLMRGDFAEQTVIDIPAF